jgi:hypothetical protein
MTDAATIISAVAGSGGVLTAIGGTGRFIWNKLEKRFEAIEQKLKACENREKTSERRAAVKLTAIELLWQEVDRLSPTSPNSTLRRVKRLLDDLKLPEPSADLDALVAEIGRRRKA